LKGLAVVAILAAIMSTADSHLNAASILFTHNVMMPDSQWQKKHPRDMTMEERERFAAIDKRKLMVMRYITGVIGGLSIFLAIMSQDIIKLVLLANGAWTAVVGFPLLAGLFYFKVGRSQFWSCAVASSISFIGSLILFRYLDPLMPGKYDYTCPFIAIVSGMIAFSVAHIYENKGIAFLKPSIRLQMNQSNQLEPYTIHTPSKVHVWNNIVNFLMSLIPTPEKISRYCVER